MKRLLLITVFLLGASSFGWAGTCPSTATTLATYETAGFSCNVGPILFSDFGYSSSATGGAVAPTNATVLVAPYQVGDEWGLQFSGGWVAGSGQTQSADISYKISCIGGCSILDAVLDVGGGVIGTGTATVNETSTTPPVINLSTNGNTVVSASSSFPGTHAVDPSDLIASAGGAAGIGHISSVINLFSVPEPASLVLVGTALLAAGLLLRRMSGLS